MSQHGLALARYIIDEVQLEKIHSQFGKRARTHGRRIPVYKNNSQLLVTVLFPNGLKSCDLGGLK